MKIFQISPKQFAEFLRNSAEIRGLKIWKFAVFNCKKWLPLPFIKSHQKVDRFIILGNSAEVNAIVSANWGVAPKSATDNLGALLSGARAEGRAVLTLT